MKSVALWGSGFVAGLALIKLAVLPAISPDQTAGAILLVAALALLGVAKTT